MSKKTIVITGSTSGLGKEITRLLASDNKLIILGRNVELLKILKDELVDKYENIEVDSIVCDYNKFSDIYKTANYINKKYQSIDIIIHNAGALLNNNNKEELHPSLKINYLSPMLLNELLSERLLKSNNPVIFYTTTLATPKVINNQILDNSKSLKKIKAYGLSKLAFNLYLIDFLNNNRNVSLKIFDPKIIYTNAVKSTIPKGFKWVFPVTRLISRTPLKVAKTAIKALLNEEDKNVTYYKLDKRKNHKNIIKNLDKANQITSYGKKLL